MFITRYLLRLWKQTSNNKKRRIFCTYVRMHVGWWLHVKLKTEIPTTIYKIPRINDIFFIEDTNTPPNVVCTIIFMKLTIFIIITVLILCCKFRLFFFAHTK